MEKLRKSLIVLIALPAIVGLSLLAGMLLAPQLPTASAAADKTGPRKFYKTRTEHIGSEALTACAIGYHMASIWEIFDPSNLRYDTELGATLDDSGLGPPLYYGGWVRTGGFTNYDLERGNCRTWTSGNGTDYGTTAILYVDWGVPNTTTRISPWLAITSTCDVPSRVWCVQD